MDTNSQTLPRKRLLTPKHACYVVSCPGSVILFGEHAVLHGHDAVSVALDKRLTCHLEPRNDQAIIIRSNLGHIKTSTDHWQKEMPADFNYLSGVLAQVMPQLASGFNLTIDGAALSHQQGLGSSACITVATLAAFCCWLDPTPLCRQSLLKQARAIVHAVTQKKGSGYDLATSIYGGLIQYNPSTLQVTPLKQPLSLSLIYTGYKTKTPDVIDHVNVLIRSSPDVYQHCLSEIGQTTTQAIQAIHANDRHAIGALMCQQQQLLTQLGVSDQTIDAIIHQLNQQPSILGAKISGSGLGDCVVALGQVPDAWVQSWGMRDVCLIPIKMSQQGMTCEQQ